MSGGRVLRGALLALGAAVLASVAWTLRRPGAAPAGAEPATPPAASSPAAPATRMDDLVYRNLKGDRQSFVMRAKRMAGREQEQVRLEVVEMEFSYVAQGEPGTGTIVSDECVYFPTKEEAYFQGHVRLTTQDGLELRTEQLIYKGQEGRASSEQPVEFRRKDLLGRAKRMDYDAAAGQLDLAGDVFLSIDGESDGAIEIESARARFLRAEGEADFEENVTLRRGDDQLTAQRVTMFGGQDELDRMFARGDVVVRSTSESLPGRPRGTRAAGPRELRCQQFDVDVRPNRKLEEAVARDGAVLVIQPGPGQARERRTLKGSVLTFRWDDQERLREVLGQKDTEFIGEPLPPGDGVPRRIRSRNFQALFDVQSGAADSAEFNKEVEFERGAQKARADRGYFDGKESKLTLNEEPVLVDVEQGSRLEGETIELFTTSGDLRARHGVRHTLERRSDAGSGLPGSGAETTVVTARVFQYEAGARVARYREGALLRSGKSELRAVEIRRVDAGSGGRRLEASGDVVTLLVPRSKAGAAERPLLDARAQEMAYDEEKRELTYKGDVILVQAEVRTQSPQAILVLTPDGLELERLEAFDPVELKQGTRAVTGQRAVYTPADRTIAVSGDKVELKDATQQLHGRTLTFFVGDDRILVDGREEARTETILRKKP